MSAGRAPFPEPLVRFVELFERGEFWESHEALEGPWRVTGSAFYQGLILYASAFVHLQRNNAHGIAAQLHKAERALAPYAPDYLGVDVASILQTARALRSRVEEEGASPAPHDRPPWRERVSVPPLRLDPCRVRGDEREARGVAGP